MTTGLLPRIAEELQDIVSDCAEAGAAEIAQEGGQTMIIVPVQAEGWSPPVVPVLFRVPLLYPDERPDLIYLDAGAHGPSGAIPRAMGAVTFLGRPWTQVSWHMTGSYDATRPNLQLFVRSTALYFRSPNP